MYFAICALKRFFINVFMIKRKGYSRFIRTVGIGSRLLNVGFQIFRKVRSHRAIRKRRKNKMETIVRDSISKIYIANRKISSFFRAPALPLSDRTMRNNKDIHISLFFSSAPSLFLSSFVCVCVCVRVCVCMCERARVYI